MKTLSNDGVMRDRNAALRSALLGLAFILAFCNPGGASTLVGTSVNGNLDFPINGAQNWWDPNSAGNSTFVVPPYLNTSGPNVVISATAPEFGWCGCGAATEVVNADFTDTGLKITTFTNAINGFPGGWIQTFTDAAFADLTITKTLDQFPYTGFPPHPDNGVTALIVGDVLTLTWGGETTGCGDCRVIGPYEADFTFSPSVATPLPAALPLFATGLGVIGLLARRRKRPNAATA